MGSQGQKERTLSVHSQQPRRRRIIPHNNTHPPRPLHKPHLLRKSASPPLHQHHPSLKQIPLLVRHSTTPQSVPPAPDQRALQHCVEHPAKRRGTGRKCVVRAGDKDVCGVAREDTWLGRGGGGGCGAVEEGAEGEGEDE